MESSEGVYDFSLIDSDLSAAQRQGGKFGFRVMALDAYIKVRQEGGVGRGRGLTDGRNGSF